MVEHFCEPAQSVRAHGFEIRESRRDWLVVLSVDGEVDMDRYSTFALPDFELDEGWTLLCKAHAVSDLEIELINYDEEMLRSGTIVMP